MKHILLTALVVAGSTAGAMLYFIPQHTDAAGIITVTSFNLGDWQLIPDESYATSYDFVPGVSSLGVGSLLVGPITNTNYNNVSNNNPYKDSFEARLPVGATLAEFDAFSFDYRLANDTTDAEDVRAKVYVKGDSSNEYDCLYTYTPSVGYEDRFKKFMFIAGFGPYQVLQAPGATIACPATLDELASTTVVVAVSLQLGDEGATDEGASAYFDNVELIVSGEATNFDLESLPQSKADCQRKGFVRYGFQNQGQCIQVTKDTGNSKK